MKTTAIFLMIAAFSLGFFVIPAFSMDEDKDAYVAKPNYWSSNKGDAMLFDLILLRPIGFAAVTVGFAATIVGLPWSISGNYTREAGDALLGEPASFTFIRPLGEVFPPQEYLDR
jgi:hypothetical protein